MYDSFPREDCMGELQSGWLAIELATIEADIEAWSDGLRDSFNSSFPQKEVASPELSEE